VDQTGRAIAATLAVGLAMLVVALIVTLSHASARRMGTNRMIVEKVLIVGSNGTLCQAREIVPAGTGALRLSIKPVVAGGGPTIMAEVMRGHTAVARGTAKPGWTGEHVVVPLPTPLRSDVTGSICITLGRRKVALGGQKTRAAVAARSGTQSLGGRLRIDYLRSTHESWWSFASTVGFHMGLGRAPGGAWAALLALTSMLVAIALGSWQLVRRDA
jgi:hypothetical protein